MFRKWFLNLIILSTGVGLTSLNGSDCEVHCSNCLGSGFLIGGYAAFQSFFFHTKDCTLDFEGSSSKGFWEYDAIQRAPGAGGFFGFGIPFCEKFNFALKAAATGFSSDARHSYFDDDPVFSFTNKMRVQYVVDLSLEPGTKIGNRLLLYIKFGASLIGLRQTRQIIDEDLPLLVVGKDRQHYHRWGYVFGAGAHTTITKCISAFAEWDWHSYSLNISTRRVDNQLESDEPLDYRLTRLYGYGFRVGLMTQF